MSKTSEHKRVSLTTLSSASTAFSSALGGSSRFGADFLDGPDKPSTSTDKKPTKTLRLNLELFQTDSCSYPEFNFSKLVYLEKKKIKKLKQKTNGFSDPFEENDDDVARIAKELEKKYGSAYASGRGKSKKDDHCDIGLGYDESDSFIDNTEAYDEVIPEEVETIEGGFYINCGALEFKELHTKSTTTKTDEIIKMPNRPKKRILSSSESSSSSEEEESDNEDSDKNSENSSEDIETATAKSKKPTEKKLKNSSGPLTKSSSSSSKNKENGSNKKKEKLIMTISCSSSSSPKAVGGVTDDVGSDSDKERIRQKSVKTTTVKDMLKAKRDNFLKMQVNGGEVKAANSKSSDEETSSSSEESDDEDDDTAVNSDSNQSAAKSKKTAAGGLANEEQSEKLRSADTKLPDLDADVNGNIHEFKEIVKTKSMVGKKFYLDDKLTEIFLKIDESLMCIEKTQRNMVFAHLEFHLQLPKYFFLRKAKQLRIKEEKLKSKRSLAKLRKAVIEVMPAAIASYEVELRKCTELQADNGNPEQVVKMPKKKFPWNNPFRQLLYDVYHVRWTSYPVLGTRKETLEEFISVYMKDKVVEIWPNGWTRYEELQREIEKHKAHVKKTNEKAKKQIISASSTAASSNNNVANAGPSAAVTYSQAISAANPTAATSFAKQFEESIANSRTNSDTESVASSGVSSSAGLKRKNNETKKQKAPKPPKASKFCANGELTAGKPVSTAVLDLISPNKRTENASNNAFNSSSPSAQHSKQHSSNTTPPSAVSNVNLAHVIDLDNYNNPLDILNASKHHISNTAFASGVLTRRDSSSESDCVEIVSVYPASSSAKSNHNVNMNVNKQKYSKKSASNSDSRVLTPSGLGNYSMDPLYVGLKTSPSSANNNNNNNNNSNSNKKHGLGVGSGLPEFDVSKVVNVLKQEMEQLQQQKPVLTPNETCSGKNTLQ